MRSKNEYKKTITAAALAATAFACVSGLNFNIPPFIAPNAKVSALAAGYTENYYDNTKFSEHPAGSTVWVYEVKHGDKLVRTIWFYQFSDHVELDYTGENSENPKVFEIPSTLHGLPVTATSDSTLCGDAEKVILPNTLKTIAGGTFQFAGFTTVNIPDSVTTIGKEAFSDNDELRNVFFGKGVASIGEKAFANCQNLKHITIPANVNTIGKQAFAAEYSSSLTYVNIMNPNIEIASDAFENQTALTDIYFAGSQEQWKKINYTNFAGQKQPVIHYNSAPRDGGYTEDLYRTSMSNGNIEYKKFKDHIEICGCEYDITKDDKSHKLVIPAKIENLPVTKVGGLIMGSVDEVVLPEGLQEINGILSYAATEIKIPSTVKVIGDYAFCTKSTASSNYTKIDIPNGVTTIGNYAFYGTKIKNIVIPDSVTSIGENAFTYSQNLESINIPKSVKEIPNRAFCYCSSLKKVDIQGKITKIGDAAFSDSGLTSFNVPESVTEIGSGCFSGSKISSITLPKNLQTIGSQAFETAGNLKEIYIPASVTKIGDNVFYGCSGLEKLNISLSNKNYTADGFSIFNKNRTKLLQVWGCGKRGIYQVPESVKEIGNRAFSFDGNLMGIKLPKNLETIGNGAFEFCFKLRELRIPKTVKKIGSRSFFSLRDCKDIYFEGTKEQWNDIFKGSYLDFGYFGMESEGGSHSLNPQVHYNSKFDKEVQITPYETSLSQRPNYDSNYIVKDYDKDGRSLKVTLTMADIKKNKKIVLKNIPYEEKTSVFPEFFPNDADTSGNLKDKLFGFYVDLKGFETAP